jgi:predicted ester cyclase
MGAVPDSRWDVSDVLADRDRVAIRITWSGTYIGAHFRGWTIPAPAKFAVEHVHIYRVAAGRLTEHWVVRDDLAMLRQLGVTAR